MQAFTRITIKSLKPDPDYPEEGGNRASVSCEEFGPDIIDLPCLLAKALTAAFTAGLAGDFTYAGRAPSKDVLLLLARTTEELIAQGFAEIDLPDNEAPPVENKARKRFYEAATEYARLKRAVDRQFGAGVGLEPGEAE